KDSFFFIAIYLSTVIYCLRLAWLKALSNPIQTQYKPLSLPFPIGIDRGLYWVYIVRYITKLCFEPGKKGYKDEQDPANLFILPFLVQDNTSDPSHPCILPFPAQDNKKRRLSGAIL